MDELIGKLSSLPPRINDQRVREFENGWLRSNGAVRLRKVASSKLTTIAAGGSFKYQMLRHRHVWTTTNGIQMQSEQVPVFNCIVYVSRSADGGMRARVANLPGIERTAATEREALSKVVSAFKQSVSELMKTSQPIPWIEPIATAESGELQRFIPVHL